MLHRQGSWVSSSSASLAVDSTASAALRNLCVECAGWDAALVASQPAHSTRVGMQKSTSHTTRGQQLLLLNKRAPVQENEPDDTNDTEGQRCHRDRNAGRNDEVDRKRKTVPEAV